jgi:hypothetical protein
MISKRFYGDEQRWWVGTVAENSGQDDPTGLSRCRVRIDGIHGPDINLDDLPYAQTIMPSTGGGTSGIGETPQLRSGAKVTGFFLDGNLSQLPIIWGYLPHIATPTIIQQELIAKQSSSITTSNNSKAIQAGATVLTDITEPLQFAAVFFSSAYLCGMAFKPHHVVGMLGNFMHESGFDKTIDPTKGSDITGEVSEGIAQWGGRSDRLRLLKEFARSPAINLPYTDLIVQLKFVVHELQTHVWANRNFLTTRNITEATMHFMRNYERPTWKYEIDGLNEDGDTIKVKVPLGPTAYFKQADGGFFPAGIDLRRAGEQQRLDNAIALSVALTQSKKKGATT